MRTRSFGWLLSCAIVLATGGCATPPGKEGAARVPGENAAPVPERLDLPADFEPQAADFADKAKGGKFMGIRYLRGRSLTEHDGVYPIHVVRAPKGRFDGNPLVPGDLVLGINGEALGKDPVYQFKTEVGRTREDTGILSFTRWRKGEIKTFTFDLNMKIPDLTKGGTPNEFHDWLLGPTGMNGWMYTEGMREGASRDARQILVTRIEEGSPAEGKVRLGDVILGVDGNRFARDARRALAAAINEAEKTENKGRLALRVWREGAEMDVELELKVLGGYSDTAPYDCPKTDKIIDMACEYLKAKPPEKNWLGYVTALGMLSTGREDLMPMIRQLARDTCVPGEVLNVETHVPMLCWHWSYKCMFLCEYYLATGDRYVLPTITEYATKIAMGQSGVGTWGHTVAAKANTGHLHGHLGGYGAINQMGLTLMICLPLAERCGVTNREIKDAVKRGETFFSYYIDKGAIPYGDHRPNTMWFDDNGKSGSAAIMFDLLGNAIGARFYSGMVVGSAPSGRETGHTGCFWSHLWGGIGAARSGRAGMAAFMKEMDYSFTLERHFSGKMVFQGNVAERGKQGEAKTKWDSTGARLLQLCVPRKRLYVTGRDMKVADPLRPDRIRELMAAGRLYTDKEARKKLPREGIIELLGDELPAVRMVGANAMREQKLECVADLVRMLGSADRYERYGACYALRDSGHGSEKAVARLVRLVESSDDLDLRLNALDALTGGDPKTSLAAAAKSAIPALLRLAVMRFDIDPRRLLQRRLGFALFDRHGLITLHGIDGLDRSILIPAIRELLTVDDGRSRGLVSSIFPKLTEDDRKALWADIYLATRDLSPSGIMFADGVRFNGLKLMQANDVAEGVDLAISFMQEDRWGKGGRVNGGIEVLTGYGPSAGKALPLLLKIKEEWTKKKASDEDMARLEAAIEAIRTGEARELKSIAPYLKRSGVM